MPRQRQGPGLWRKSAEWVYNCEEYSFSLNRPRGPFSPCKIFSSNHLCSVTSNTYRVTPTSVLNDWWSAVLKRTVPMLKLNEGKKIILLLQPEFLALKGSKLGIYTLNNSPEVFWRLTPIWGLNERARADLLNVFFCCWHFTPKSMLIRAKTMRRQKSLIGRFQDLGTFNMHHCIFIPLLPYDSLNWPQCALFRGGIKALKKLVATVVTVVTVMTDFQKKKKH